MRRASPPPARNARELKTYRELALGRELKSIRARRRVDAKGRERIIGDGSSSLPYLAVDARRYREVRLEHQRRLLLEARGGKVGLDPDRLLRQLAPRVEGDGLCTAGDRVAPGTKAPSPRDGPRSRADRGGAEAFCRVRARRPRPPARPPSALDRVLHQVEKRQVPQPPARYQTVWAQLIGPELASQSQLDRIDAATQTAWFRCYNSVLSTELQRRRGLPEKLGRALNLPVKRLRVSF